jgi:hypothetical protein
MKLRGHFVAVSCATGDVMTIDVMVVGNGALATAVCDGLASARPHRSVTVAVAARDPDAAARTALTAAIRASETGAPARFESRPLADLTGGAVRPAVLVVCASHQSPYEHRNRPSAWTALLRAGGFGLGLALQATLVAGLARAMSRHSPETVVVNGCFPDAVNPLLRALGAPVVCGIGNVATVAAALRASLDKDREETTVTGESAADRLRVLAHHAHLGGPVAGPAARSGDARAWLGAGPVPDVTDRLAPARALPRLRLNDIAGLTGAHAVLALLGERPVAAHVPGPSGLPGGYPVTIANRAVSLDLPPGVTERAAVAWNQRAGEADGVIVDDGRVVHTDRAARALEPYLPDLAGGWPADSLPDVGRRLLALRERLRSRPPTEQDPTTPRRTDQPTHDAPLPATQPDPAAPDTLTAPPRR